MERVFQKCRNFKEAEKWDVLQHIGMTIKNDAIFFLLICVFQKNGEGTEMVRMAMSKEHMRYSTLVFWVTIHAKATRIYGNGSINEICR